MRERKPGSARGRSSVFVGAVRVLLLLLVAGCSVRIASGPADAARPVPGTSPAPPPGTVTVYFYSLAGTVRPESPVWILEGNDLVAALEADSYAAAHLRPGEHWLRSWTTTAPPETYDYDVFDFPAGRASYVRIEEDGSLCPMPDGAELDLRRGEAGLEERTVTRALREVARNTTSPFPTGAAGTGDQPTDAPLPTQEGVLVRSGTAIPLRVIENLNSFNTRPGEPVLFGVVEEVRIEDIGVVPRDLIVEGLVDQVHRPGQAGMPGFVGVRIFRLVLPSGDVIPLQAYLGSSGRPSGPVQTLGAIGNAGVNEAISNANPYALGLSVLMLLAMAAVRGHDAWVGAGTTVTAVVSRDTAVTVSGIAVGEEPFDFSPQEPIAASSMGPIVVPDSGRVTASWSVRLELPAAPSEIRITSAGDLPPPREIPATQIVSHGTWQEARFPAWPVARFAVLGPFGPAVVPVVLEGTLADGSPFVATTEATVRTGSTR